MNKAERKQELKIVEAHLAKGIKENSQHHIEEAYRHLENLLADVGIFRLSEFPTFPNKQSKGE
jgi:hypothetical protein